VEFTASTPAGVGRLSAVESLWTTLSVAGALSTGPAGVGRLSAVESLWTTLSVAGALPLVCC